MNSKNIFGNFEAPLVLLTGLRNASDVGMVAAAAAGLPCSSIQQSHRGVVLLLLFCVFFFFLFCFVLLSIDLNVALHVLASIGKKDE